MEWESPSMKEYQSKRHAAVRHEYDASDYLRGGVNGERPQSYLAGAGSKFSRGPGRGPAWVEEREARETRAAERFYAKDAARSLATQAAACRTGFDPITASEISLGCDVFRPRGRVACEDGPSALRAMEAAARDREPGTRMFRLPEDTAAPRVAYRATVLVKEGPHGGFTRTSSVIGFGRAQLPSSGVAEALETADYGGLRAPVAHEEGERAGHSRSLSRPPLSGIASSAWDVHVVRADDAARAVLAVTRAPNRIFDVHSDPVIGLAVPDFVAREIRELKELAAKRPPKPASQPSDFTATARRLAAGRDTTLIEKEVAAVAALR